MGDAAWDGFARKAIGRRICVSNYQRAQGRTLAIARKRIASGALELSKPTINEIHPIATRAAVAPVLDCTVLTITSPPLELDVC